METFKAVSKSELESCVIIKTCFSDEQTKPDFLCHLTRGAAAGRTLPADLLGSSSAAAARQRNGTERTTGLETTKSRTEPRARSENSCKPTRLQTQLCHSRLKHTPQLTERHRKSPNQLLGVVNKEFGVLRGTNSTSVGAEFLYISCCVLRPPSSPDPPPLEHALPEMR